MNYIAIKLIRLVISKNLRGPLKTFHGPHVARGPRVGHPCCKTIKQLRRKRIEEIIILPHLAMKKCSENTDYQKQQCDLFSFAKKMFQAKILS